MLKLPAISICLPTYNNEKTIDICLKYLRLQDYPRELIEIIIIDGGSLDNTVNICKKYTDIILDNPDRIEETGRAIGVDNAKGDIVGFIDADNFIDDTEFLRKMIQPFIDNPGVVFCEPEFYSSRPADNLLTKYVSLIGGDDPVAVYLGVYDRYCYFKRDWTGSPYFVQSAGRDYRVIKLKDCRDMPPFGANGCFIRKDKIREIKYRPFLHTDVVYRLLLQNNLFAKVNTHVVHAQDGSLSGFLKKKYRRASRNYSSLQREYCFRVPVLSMVFLVLRSVLIIPLVVDAVRGYRKKKDAAWVLHPFMVISVILVYALARFRKLKWKIS